MQQGHHIYIVMLLMATALWSCGKSGDIARISALQERMSTEQDPTEKSELANRLHREYSLFHLQNKGDTLFLRQWARMAEAGKEFEHAIDVYTMLLDRDPALPKAHASRGRLYAGLGYYSEASADYGKAVSLLPVDNTAKRREHEYLSDFYHRADSVIRRESTLIAQKNDAWVHLLNRAEQYLDCGYYRAAVADIEPVLEADSTYARAHYLLAIIFMASGEYERSELAFKDYFLFADAADKDLTDAQKQRQRLVQLVQMDALERALAAEPYAYDHLVDAAATAFRLEAYNKAMIYANRLTEIFPDSIFGFLYRGQVGIRRGDLDQAMDDMNRVLELEPSNISARNLRGYILLLGNEYELLQKEIGEIRSRGGALFQVLRPYASGNE